MRATLAFTAAFAAGALAGPILKRQDEVTVTDIATTVDVVYTTVFGSAPAATTPATTPASSPQHKWHWSWSESSTPSSTSVAAPPPTSPSSTPVAVASSSSSVAAPPVTSAAASSSSSAAAPANSMASAAIARHNDHRRNHTDTPDVTWDDTLASEAQTVANMCNWTHVTTVGSGQYGQNYGASPSGSTIEDAIEMWYSETTMFLDSYYGQLSPANRGCTLESNGGYSCPEYGHFTQMIWKSSTTIGCAIGDCSAGYIGGDSDEHPDGSEDPVFQVCNYGPAGNVNPELSAQQSSQPSMIAWASSVGYPDNLAKPTGLPAIS